MALTKTIGYQSSCRCDFQKAIHVLLSMSISDRSLDSLGTVGELRATLGEYGMFSCLDRYRPVQWLDSPTPFAGSLVYKVMTQIVLCRSGWFDINQGMYGLESASYIRGQTPAHKIPKCTWVSCMVNVCTMLINPCLFTTMTNYVHVRLKQSIIKFLELIQMY